MNPVVALERASASELMPPGSSILLAVSGGADSMALLYGATSVASAAGWRLAIGHVHHGWRGRDADRDLAFVGDQSRRLGLPFFWRRRDARREARRLKLSPEAAAREVRYAALAEMARQAGTPLVATAHHRDDRIESFLIALQRRAGLAALAGPRIRREDGIVRPLLSVTRAEILEFLRRSGIPFRRDRTNGDLALPRNRVRRALAILSAARGQAALEILAREVERLDSQREKMDREFAESVRPSLSMAPGSVVADARLLEKCGAPLQRRAIEEAARPFAAPGRAPLTGREREQILRKLTEGRDFCFEAGRRIRFERRGALFRVGPRLSGRPERV